MFTSGHFQKFIIIVLYIFTINFIVFISKKWDDSVTARQSRDHITARPFGRTKCPRNISQERVVRIMDFNSRTNSATFSFKNCEYSRCAMTTRPEEANILVINGARLHGITLPRRRKDQIWVMFSREPMTDKRFLLLNHTSLHGQFNWTMTYRSDSDFVLYYGMLTSREPPEKNYEKINAEKKYDVAWFVSHCHTSSKREDYVRRMSKVIQVHIYGKCGNLTCGSKGYLMGGNKEQCLKMLSRDYRFYLSFENSFCHDYVTEKFFNLFPEIDVIPVVRGGADYKKNFPPDIYINTADFQTPENLARYLQTLSRDKDKYLAMLKRKNSYVQDRPAKKIACELCKAAHIRSPDQVYNNLYDWITQSGNCWSPKDM